MVPTTILGWTSDFIFINATSTPGMSGGAIVWVDDAKQGFIIGICELHRFSPCSCFDSSVSGHHPRLFAAAAVPFNRTVVRNGVNQAIGRKVRLTRSQSITCTFRDGNANAAT